MQGYKYLLTARLLVGHNCRMYDIPVLERLVGLPNGLPLLPRSLDTLLCSRLLFSDRFTNPVKGHSLSEWGAYLKFPKTAHADWSKFSTEMLDYCTNDVELGTRIYQWQLKRLAPYKQAVQLEHAVASIIVKQIQNGYTLDVPAVEKLQQVLQEEKATINDELNKVFPPIIEEMKTPAYWIGRVLVGDSRYEERKFPTKGAAQKAKAKAIVPGPNKTKSIPFNPGSGKQIAERLIAYGWKPTVLTDSGAVCTDGKVLESIDIPQAAGLKRHRLLVDREGDAQGWLNHLAPDGRVHGSVTTNGCVTGRMSHSDPNMNVPKNKSDFGKQMRACWIPRKGWVQVGCDASGLELRMLAHYMWEYDKGAYAKIILEGDVHTANQNAAGLPDREVAKTFIYAFLYGAGDGKIGKIISGGVDAGRKLKQKFTTGFPALGQLLRRIAFDVAKGRIIGLDGRAIPIRSQHAALNTLLQGAGAVLMKQALVLHYEAVVAKFGPHGGRWAYLVNVHDEWQVECEPEIAEEMGKIGVESMRLAGKKLGIRIQIDGEYKIGANWAEAH